MGTVPNASNTTVMASCSLLVGSMLMVSTSMPILHPVPSPHASGTVGVAPWLV
jgi:hypothetical protein